ncbi:hypothetical protein QZJ86_14505 [Methylomonas montana]|uniref:hypothetical protein n=1 Tax=Methylomonas montana TaxID=3058963 RepID=UPI002657C9A8|nr:hypothetical protein [Methylomonas montana]WKJ89229.1 hypothetical protein QZJ86_14505 [Methylomonas montana]
MKSIAKWLLPVLLLPLLLFALALSLALEDTPKLRTTADLAPEQIARGKQIFKQNDPRRLKSGSIAKVALNQEDLDLAINYLANQYAGGVASLRIDSDKARIEATLRLPANPFGQFLNLSLGLKQTPQLPSIDQLKLGKLWIPGMLAEPLIRYGITALQPEADRQTFANLVKHVNFQPRRMIVTYRWRDDLPGKLRGVLLSTDDQKRIEAYQRRLAELNLDNRNPSLTTLSKPLFKLAQERSASGDPIAENRALILVLTFYANKTALPQIVPQSSLWPRPLWRTVTLNGRDDLAKHYLVSAMLAAYSGTPLADAVGLFKEIEDSRGGSGFSFNDIAADRAGTRLGEQAVANASRAQTIQTLLATADEKQMMPATADLPEFLPEDEFIRRFGGIEGEAYRQMMQDIERRIAALPVYRD